MKRFVWILLLLLMAVPACSAATKKITVQQLKDLLASLQAAKKSDAEVAAAMKDVELTEELTTSTMNGMADLVAGNLSTEQLYVFEARTAILPPPASELPTAAAPDAATQQALLAKASDYASKTYAQLPHLTGNKTIARFQDVVEVIHSDSGMGHSIAQTNNPTSPTTNPYVRLINLHTDPLESENGIEKPPAAKDKTAWGKNNMVASVGAPLTLNTIMQEASANGNLKWLRWETLNGIQTAVFAFSIDKKKTHFAINYCCFPDTDTVEGTSAPRSARSSSAETDVQAVSDWKPFKSNAGYHGEIFINPDTGIVVRTVTQAEFKFSDPVHSEAIRSDYAALPIGGKSLVVPVRSFTIAEVVPNGDSFAAKYAARHMLVTQEYKDYALAAK